LHALLFSLYRRSADWAFFLNLKGYCFCAVSATAIPAAHRSE